MTNAKRLTLSLLRRMFPGWLLLLFSFSPAMGEATFRMSSQFLARGEQTLLEITVTGGQPVAHPVMPTMQGVEIRPVGNGLQTRMMPGRRMEYIFEYLLSSYEIGNHTLPPVKITSTAGDFTTAPLNFSIFNPDDLQWSEISEGPSRFRYATIFRVLNPNPYEGETVPVEIKLYVPRNLAIEDWGIPDFERDGLTCWRFQPSPMRGQVNLLGETFLAIAYPSTLSITRSGQASIGPATIRLINAPMVMDGFLRRVAHEVHVAVPKCTMTAQPLPPGAPDGFENAVGHFSLNLSSSIKESQEGEPIPLDITVTGSGNLDTLRPPKPVKTDGWKLYEATPETRGDERREFFGTTVFKQFIRPLEPKTAVPPFRLVFFDPKKQAYETVLSEPLPILVKPAPQTAPVLSGPPPTVATPVERMADILGLLPTSSPALRTSSPSTPWELLARATAATTAIGLILRALWLRFGHLLRRDPVKRRRLETWRTFARNAPSDDAAFLRAAGRFIEISLPTPRPAEIEEIIQLRDDLCFRPEIPAEANLTASRRKQILNELRRAVLILTFGLAPFFFSPTSNAAETNPPPAPATSQSTPESLNQLARQAYEAAKFPDAITLWLQVGRYEDLTAATLYHIGIACYRAGSPGHAALYFRRALERDPTHQESLQNLRFIETRHGSLTVHRPDYQYLLASYPISFWRALFWSGIWLCLLAWLIFPATRSGNRLRLAAVVTLILAPLIIAVGGLGWRYYPNDALFSPLARQAVVTAPDAIVFTDATRTSPQVIDAPPGSLCEIVHQSGSWSYIAFASKTRGWIPSSSIERILPNAPLTPPKIRKPAATGKSA